MAELFEKHAQILQGELEAQAVDQLRKDRNEEMWQELLKRAQKDINRVAAGEVTKMIEKYERTFQEDVEADEDMRKEYNEMIQKPLKEAQEEIEKLVAGVKRKVGFVEKYEQALRKDFEAAEQLRDDRDEELRQELLKGERKISHFVLHQRRDRPSATLIHVRWAGPNSMHTAFGLRPKHSFCKDAAPDDFHTTVQFRSHLKWLSTCRTTSGF
ncbi:hypothetical protein EV401DRAFT_2070999 [Pisolithus croceorrhizus]|nr:hypothetical protein EV401DRAFT_2070999 [Pisolithus croceorrhizus]